MTPAEQRCERLLDDCEANALSVPVTLMEMLIACEDVALVRRVASARAASSPRAAEVVSTLEANGAGCARVAAMLRSGVDSSEPAPSVDAGIAFAKRLFDWSVTQSEEASVALYSLGSPSILQQATDEIVALLHFWGLTGKDRAALDIGCGIGRMEQALWPHFARIDAVDVSSAMIAAARRRCAGLTNIHLSTVSGHDLASFGDGQTDLVFAVDSFPYIVQSGMPLVERHFAEAARVLKPGGDFLILNFSYRSDENADSLDRADVARLAQGSGFAPVASGERPFKLWNGVAFHLRKGV